MSLGGAHLAPAVAIPVMLFSSQDECRLAIRREERYPLTGDSKSYDIEGIPIFGVKNRRIYIKLWIAFLKGQKGNDNQCSLFWLQKTPDIYLTLKPLKKVQKWE